MIFFGAFSFILYQNQKILNYNLAENRLKIMSKIIEISIFDGNLNKNFINSLAVKSGTYIGILDKDLGKFTISDSDIIDMDIFLGLKNITSKTQIDTIDDKEVLYYALDTIIDDRSYIIVVASNLDSIFVKFKDIMFKILVAFFICFILSFLIARILNSVNRNELKKIENFLSKIANKDYGEIDINTKITEFKQINIGLENLRNTILKLDKKTRKKNAKIRLKNMQLETILSSISHEFKNPIAIIETASQTLQKDKNMPRNLQDKFLNKINANCQKIVDLIDKIRVSFDNHMAPDLSEYDIFELANEAKDEIPANFTDRKIIIKGEHKILKIDKILIKQVILNLLENALKYSQDEVLIEINDECLLVIDKGIGISSENIALVSKKYFRIDTNSWNNSFGLGLFIVKQILKLHGFKLSIKSQFGSGSQIGFYFKN